MSDGRRSNQASILSPSLWAFTDTASFYSSYRYQCTPREKERCRFQTRARILSLIYQRRDQSVAISHANYLCESRDVVAKYIFREILSVQMNNPNFS